MSTGDISVFCQKKISTVTAPAHEILRHVVAVDGVKKKDRPRQHHLLQFGATPHSSLGSTNVGSSLKHAPSATKHSTNC
jgi:hypothetical protein